MALQGWRRSDQNTSKGKAVVNLLIQARADVNAVRSESDWRGCGSSHTAFEMALSFAMQDAAMLEQFLAAGANPNTKSIRNVSSMRTDGRAVEYILHKGVHAKSLDVVRALLNARADVDAVAQEHMENERGFHRHMEQTALHIACMRGDLAIAALLLARGAEVNLVRKDLDQEERPRPKKAALTDDPREAGYVSPVICWEVEETALHIALRMKNPALVALLVCFGADTAKERRRGKEHRSPADLCGQDPKLLEALKAEWSEATLAMLPAEIRPDVEAARAQLLGPGRAADGENGMN
jgi:ankyrin repeat protein